MIFVNDVVGFVGSYFVLDSLAKVDAQLLNLGPLT